MVYYVLLVLAKLIPGEARRQRFVGWARARFSVRAIVDAALVEHLASIERAIHRTQMIDPPKVMSVDETLDALIGGSSIVRFGDGELECIVKWQIAFQGPDDALAERLKEVLSSDEPGLLVAVNGLVYELGRESTSAERDFYLTQAPWMRPVLSRYLRPGKIYAAAEATLVHTMYRQGYDRRTYFRRFRSVWDGAKVVLIHGEGIFDDLTHDIFDNASSIDHILAPRQNAFDRYDDILREALRAPKDSLMIAILGPTATVLAYDLHRAGYRSLDLGHIAKSYDWWQNGRIGDEAEFFAD